MTPREAFEEKAPRLSPERVTEAVRDDVLAPPVRDAARSGWLHGSFADPASGLDREDPATPGGPHGLSDVDVFVVIEGWGDRTLATRFTASEHGLLCRLAAQGELRVSADADRPERLDRPAVSEDLRDAVALPATALETTVRRAERTAFHARDFDVDHLQLRELDLTLGGREAFDRLVGDESRIRLWPQTGG